MWRIVQAVFLAVGFVVAVLLLAPHRDAGRQAIFSFAYAADADQLQAGSADLVISASPSPPGALAPRAAGAVALDRALGLVGALALLALLALSFDVPDHPGFHWVNVSRGRSGLTCAYRPNICY